MPKYKRGLTISELIKELSKYPPEASVFVRSKELDSDKFWKEVDEIIYGTSNKYWVYLK